MIIREKCKKCDGGVRAAYSIHGRRIGLTECPYCGGTGKVATPPMRPLPAANGVGPRPERP